MGTTPNLVQLERLLLNGAEYLARNPASSGSSYRAQLDAALQTFREARANTDASYLTWRTEFNASLKAHKAVRLAYDRARKNCIEWGVDSFPDDFISYMDGERTQTVAYRMVKFLKALDLDADWVPELIEALETTLANATQVVTRQEKTLAQYRRSVHQRIEGYNAGFGAVTELFELISGELEFGTEEFYGLSPNPY